MSDVKGPVTDRFTLAGYDQSFLNEHIFLSADEAISELTSQNTKRQSTAYNVFAAHRGTGRID